MENFEDVKLGELVLIRRMWLGTFVGKVTKVNKTTFEVTYPDPPKYDDPSCGATRTVKFNKATGWEWGNSKGSYKWYADRATEEKIAKVRLEDEIREYATYLSGIGFNAYANMPYETLKNIYQLVKENNTK
jgi:hypothetical protein